jgi:plasmid replication initiation protein
MKKQHDIVIESNVLLESRYNITPLEMKLFLSVISQIKAKDKSFHTYRVYLQDFISKTLIKTHNYDYIKTACKRLVSKTIEILEGAGTKDEGHLLISFFSSARTYKQHGYVDINIDPKLRPYLLQLRENFTIYDIRNVLFCRSIHSIRIYQLLKQYERIGKRTISLEDLKKMLGLKPSQYSQWINFKSFVITPAEHELKKYSDIYFTYTTTKKGRKIALITFEIHKKRQKRMFDTKDSSPYPTYEQVIQDMIELDKTPPIPYDKWAEQDS